MGGRFINLDERFLILGFLRPTGPLCTAVLRVTVRSLELGRAEACSQVAIIVLYLEGGTARTDLPADPAHLATQQHYT